MTNAFGTELGSELGTGLEDEDTREEIRMVTELMVVAAMAPGELEQDVIDTALGLHGAVEGFPSQRRPD